jgi:hypothetical protein
LGIYIHFEKSGFLFLFILAAQSMNGHLIHLLAAISGRLKLCFSAPALDWRMTDTNWTGIIPQAGRTPRQLFDRQDFNLNSCMSYTTTA